MALLDEITNGRTDLVFEYLAAGNPANSTDTDGVSLLKWCAYYGDVSAMKYLLEKGAPLESLGDNLGLDAACFHGHWRLSKFLIERGADVNSCQEVPGNRRCMRRCARRSECAGTW